ncbi:hypothetical protein IRJ41_021781 [Triplophysa rosa]|uniref:Uncharacterized protein n=1 Tax=Triplophysa rosa TaxID=992332 RepID=A0A9W7WF76_TRIRA|nr:hypothetical protein IRJ41_021781 [Triplophysa rosa]
MCLFEELRCLNSRPVPCWDPACALVAISGGNKTRMGIKPPRTPDVPLIGHGRLNLRTVGCGTGHPLPGLIRVPLLDTHQRWQPPTLRHPPPHQSDDPLRIDSATRALLLGTNFQPPAVSPSHAKDVSVMDIPPYAAISATWLTTVPAAT